MSKSIYEKALEELTRLLHDEFDDNPKRSRLNVSQRLNMFKKVKDALAKAQKQEKLLELYRELDDCIIAPEGHYVCRYEDDEKYARIRKQIKELENE